MAIISMISSCFKDDNIMIKREDNIGNDLLLDGYYCSSEKCDSDQNETYFLNRNGVILYGGIPDIAEITNSDSEYYKRIRSRKYYWGAYKILNDMLVFEKWNGEEKPFTTSLFKAKIVNSTHFIIESVSDGDGSDEQTRNEKFFFKKFSPKPDSTNVFIK